jgi:hypothetical protein
VVRRRDWRGLGDCDAVVSGHELAGEGRQGRPGFLRSGNERGKEGDGMEGEAGRPGLHAELAGDVGRRQNTRATRPPGSARAPRRGRPRPSVSERCVSELKGID